jgi:hypothetical protein
MAVTLLPFWLTVAFQALVIRWSPGNVKVSCQLLTGALPVSAMVTFATKPPAHSLVLV